MHNEAKVVLPVLSMMMGSIGLFIQVVFEGDLASVIGGIMCISGIILFLFYIVELTMTRGEDVEGKVGNDIHWLVTGILGYLTKDSLRKEFKMGEVIVEESIRGLDKLVGVTEGKEEYEELYGSYKGLLERTETSIKENRAEDGEIPKGIREKAVDLLTLFKEDIEVIQEREISKVEESMEKDKSFVESRRSYMGRVYGGESTYNEESSIGESGSSGGDSGGSSGGGD